ncbi:MAG TPA: formylglycine-generating enzyme family protein [Baekduia sp.]
MSRARATLVTIPAGSFLMGNDDRHAIPGDGEGPVRTVDLDAYAIDAHAVTNARFAAFVEATNHVTTAESEGWSFVFAGFLPDDFPPTRAVAQAPWWRQVYGADWSHPEGPQSDLGGRAGHPVVHVSRHDAEAYCAWVGLRLPTEAEWERAARGGLTKAVYAWGDELTPGGQHRANIWQGRFPTNNTGDDGYLATCPVDAFEPNGLGLHNTAGNVWEWTSGTYSRGGLDGLVPMRGGSHLCHASYCDRYRVAARTANTPDASSGHLGFRVAADA